MSSSCFSIASYRVVRALAHYQQSFGTIVDVGANAGQFCVAAARRFPGAAIHAFEPVYAAFQELRRNTRRYPNVKTYNRALGSRSGRICFYQNNYTQVSSALIIDPANDHPNYSQQAAHTVEVDIGRLDGMAPQLNLAAPVLLKLDVQGYEKEVLIGSAECLPLIDYIVLELPFVRLYENQALFEEMDDFLKALGYELVAPLGFNEGKDLAIIEMDCLYRRRGQRAP